MRRKSLLVALLLAAPLVCAAPAHAFVYWADAKANTIGRANNDGSGADDAFIHTGKLPSAVAIDSTHIFWTNQNSDTIGRANLDGSGVDNAFLTGIAEPSGVAVNATSIYWSSLEGNKVGRANVDGSSPAPALISAQSPCGVALDSGHVYWTSLGSPSYVGRASLSGLNVKSDFVTMNAASPCGIAVNSANIFWTDFGFFGPNGTNIGRANTLTGEGVDESMIGTASAPCGVALDSSGHIYWANAATDTIGRAHTDATEVNESYIATGGQEICGVAVDDLAPAPTPTPEPTPEPGPAPTRAASQLRLGKVTPHPKAGTATLALTVGGAGSLSLAGKGVAKARKSVKRAGAAKLTIKATGSAAAALKKHGKVRVKALVKFAQAGDTPTTRAKKIVLKRS